MSNKFTTQKNILFLSLGSLIVGFLLMVCIHTNQAAEVNQEDNTGEIISYIEEVEQEITELELQIQQTREQIESLETAHAEDEVQTAEMTALLNNLNLHAQTTALEGPGIIITLDDNTVGAELAKKNNPSTYSANAHLYIIHDKDLLHLVRSLAHVMEACSINGVRIIDSSTIRCVGTTILINSVRLAPPYEIKMIGDSTALELALVSSATYRSLDYYDMPVKYEKQQLVSISPYTGVFSTTYSAIEEVILDDEDSENEQDD